MTTVLTNARIFTGGADLTAQSNKVELGAEREEKDVTTYLPEGDADSGWKKVTGGLAQGACAITGFWEAGDNGKVDDRSWADLGGLTGWTIAPLSSAAGSLAYLMKAERGKYIMGGQVGEVNPYSADCKSSWPLVRGVMLHPAGTARSSTGTGTAVEVSAVSSTQYLYSSLHVLSRSGTATLTVTIESSVDDTFGSPTTVLTFTQASAISGEILRTAGAITDTWYRVKYTIGGTGSVLFACSLGVF